jgi:hypothetical protein
MPTIHYGSLFLDSETGVLFLAVAFFAWLLKCNRLAAACAAAGIWLVFSPSLEPIFANAFAHVPWWVPLLIVLYAITRFAGSLMSLFFGQRFGREVMVHATAPLVSDAMRLVYRVPLFCLRWLSIGLIRGFGMALAFTARCLLQLLAR